MLPGDHIAILGSTPALSALELKQLGWLTEWDNGSIAGVTAETNLETLGGTVKIAEVVEEIPRSLDGIEVLQEILQKECTRSENGEIGKVRFGFSVYAADNQVDEQVARHYAKKLKKTGITWKKAVKQEFAGVPIRYVESQEPALSSVIVHKEKLLPTKTDFIIAVYKKKIVLGRTLEVQDYKNFSKRDYGRPERDHKSGMLPPKVARMMVNIANPQPGELIVDPFCGSGTVLQEASLLGHEHVRGSDLSSKAIEDSFANLEWLELPHIDVQKCDVRNLSSIFSPASINCIVAEGYLGPTRPKKTDKVHRQMRKLYLEAFAELPKVLAPGARVVLGVPAWQRYDRLQTLDIETELASLGFTAFHAPVIYGRSHAKVVRQILCLSYKSV